MVSSLMVLNLILIHTASSLLRVDIIKEGQFQEPNVNLYLFVVELLSNLTRRTMVGVADSLTVCCSG